MALSAPFSPLRLTPRACDLPVHKTTGPSLYRSFGITLATISITVKVPKSRSPIHVRVSSTTSPLLIGLSDITRSRFLLQRFPCTRNPRNAEPRLLGISRHVSLRSMVLTVYFSFLETSMAPNADSPGSSATCPRRCIVQDSRREIANRDFNM
jgi:hypothetical protein